MGALNQMTDASLPIKLSIQLATVANRIFSIDSQKGLCHQGMVLYKQKDINIGFGAKYIDLRFPLLFKRNMLLLLERLRHLTNVMNRIEEESVCGKIKNLLCY